MITLFVQEFRKENSTVYEVNPRTNIGRLREKISLRNGNNHNDQHIFFEKHITLWSTIPLLRTYDDTTLNDFGIEDKSKIYISKAKCGE